MALSRIGIQIFAASESAVWVDPTVFVEFVPLPEPELVRELLRPELFRLEVPLLVRVVPLFSVLPLFRLLVPLFRLEVPLVLLFRLVVPDSVDPFVSLLVVVSVFVFVLLSLKEESLLSVFFSVL